MSHQTTDERSHLLIPVQIDALVVNPKSLDAQTTSLARNYAEMTQNYRPALRNLFVRAELDAGIHLHFRLPDLFTHAAGADATDFPRIPNRWLVQRYAGEGGKSVPTQAWIISSDREAKGINGIRVPSFAGDPVRTKLDLRPRGTQEEVANNRPVRISKENVPAEVWLTAVCGGDPAFSSHYPACRSILGFRDDMAGVEKGVKISYLVTGWYSSLEEDPFVVATRQGRASHEEMKQWLAERRCSLQQEDELPDGILCHGLIGNIGWPLEDSQDPVSRLRSKKEQKQYIAAVGNSIAEGMSVFSPEVMGEGELAEDTVAGAQTGVLDHDPSLAELDSELHRMGFIPMAGGTDWLIESAQTPAKDAADTVQGKRHLPPVPLQSLRGLDELNELQRKLDRLNRLYSDYRWEVYAVWHRWTNALMDAPSDPAAEESAPILKKNLEALEAFLTRLRGLRKEAKKKRDAAFTTVSEGLPHSAYALASAPARPFHTPKDPVVVIAGPAMKAINAATEDSATLICRVVRADQSGDVWKELNYKDRSGETRTLNAARCLKERGLHTEEYLASVPLVARMLLAEACLFETSGSEPFNEELAITRLKDIGIDRWRGNPWIPLCVLWKAEWTSDYEYQADRPLTPSLLSQWKCEYGPPSAQYRRTTDLVQERSPAQTKSDPFEMRGWSLLTRPLAKRNAGLLADFTTEPKLALTLGGFHDALIHRQVGDSLPPLDFTRWEKERGNLYQAAVADVLWPHEENGADDDADTDGLDTAPAPAESFYPVRSGLLQLTRLWVVDTFGRYVELDKSVARYSSRLRGSQTFEEGATWLRPRFTRPMRLDFSSAPNGSPAGTDPIPTPVCGWVLPNRLDRNLTFYRADGTPLGAFQERFGLKPGTGGKYFYWVDFPADSKSTLVNGHLGQFKDFIASLDLDAGESFMNLIEEANRANRQKVPDEDRSASLLVGRPLALVRATLKLDIFGLPPLDQSMSWKAEDNELANLLQNFDAGTSDALKRTGGAEKIQWPVRLGDSRSGNDGLVGFFADPAKGKSSAFHANWGLPLNRSFTDILESEQGLALDCTTAVSVTMLMDPQARVHATMGALPRTFFELPASAAAGVRNLRDAFFQTAPVLGGDGAPQIPRPSDEFGAWSWAYRPAVNLNWSEDPSFASATDRAGFAIPQATISEGWLKLNFDPVRIHSFWQKTKDAKVPPNSNVILAWSVRGATSLTLFQLDAQGKRSQLARWEGELETEATIPVANTAEFELEAANSSGEKDCKRVKVITEASPHGNR
jgi:hypothetical protein